VNILYGNEAVNCKHLNLKPGHVRPGDFLVIPGGVTVRVQTVQGGCPYIENLNRSFCNILCVSPNGERLQVRPANKVEVFRRRK
jgi:hypothetical protein